MQDCSRTVPNNSIAAEQLRIVQSVLPVAYRKEGVRETLHKVRIL